MPKGVFFVEKKEQGGGRLFFPFFLSCFFPWRHILPRRRKDVTHMAEKQHRLLLEGRQRLLLEGVEEVISFDETCLLLETSQGSLTVQGEEMHVEQLDVEEGRLVVGGEIGSLSYDEGAGGGKGNLLGRIFR